ncbi:type II secretion system F family protein [Haloplasma contractile]|uniref:Type II secretory pathway component protein F n=1 Tax=Haloplasma contractile SSD-17B TaxID=1033810 RepID=U2E044_9MOLU|nr:type II secretion system F family protein [Haloplasma contractile]ERJ13802.1 Type II secretory pathway component protein F [Haloplasma contractile SSD-17B]
MNELPFYRYRASSKDIYEVSDVIEAYSRKEAINRLKKLDLTPIEVEQLRFAFLYKDLELSLGSKISRKDLVFFLSQLSKLLHAGVGVMESFRIIVEQTTNKNLQKVLLKILHSLRNGTSLYLSMLEHRKVFPNLLVEMIRIGEATGELTPVIDDLETYYTKQTKTSNEIRSAMLYPIVLLVVTVAVTIFLMIVVVPQFQKTFESAGQELPMITKFVLEVSAFFKTSGLLVGLGLAAVAVLINMYKKTEKGHRFFSKFALKVPIFGNINKNGNIIRLSRSLATLINNSVNAIESIQITRNIITNDVYQDVLDKSLYNIQNGIPISAAFSDQWAVDPVFARMLSIGEETATLGEMMNSLAEYYDREMDSQVERLKTLLEPLMIIFLALIVGTIVLSIMIPMYGLMDSGYGM